MNRNIYRTGSKYRNRKIRTDDGVFDSLKEYRRWMELKLLERAGEISNLRRQVPFILIPTQYDMRTGKLLERECRYIADFVYNDEGYTVVEDAKGVRTDVFKIKKKLMLDRFGIRVQEV